MPVRRFQNSSFRFLVVVAAIAACDSFAEHSIAQETPMTFVQRRDVSQEIRATPAQLLAARSLDDVCDQACQQRMRETIQNLDPSFFQQFQALSPEDREQVATTANRENREIVEMEVLEDNILDPLQMVRFNQLWQQNLGVAALTSPATTQLLNMSPEQINQIQQFQNDATAMIDACRANPNLTDAQKNTFITNINNITIDNSISILENAQIGELTINLGQPFTFDDVAPTAPSDPIDPSAPSNREPLPQGPISGEPPSLIAQNGSQGSSTRGGLTEATATQNGNIRGGNRTNTRTNARTRINTPRNSNSQARSRNSQAAGTQGGRSRRPSRATATPAPRRSQPAASRSRQPSNQGGSRR